VDFEFAETDQLRRFFERLTRFGPAFERLQNVSNKVLGRTSNPRSAAEHVCFGLAHTCREDYLEILFLASNGHGEGALKLLRGLYERAVTLAYIAKYPTKAERFRKFAVIQEYRAMRAMLKMMTKDQLEENLGAGSVAAYTEAYERAKPEFRGREISWDVGLAKMMEDLGSPYDQYYLGSYIMPNFRVHATLTSVFDGTPRAIRDERSIKNADLALLNATACLLATFREQNRQFALHLDEELEICERDLVEVFVTRSL
jgi:hypothetical protein